MAHYSFVPDEAPAIVSLLATLQKRTSTASPYVPPLPNVGVIARRVLPHLDMSASSLQYVLHEFVAALGEPHRSRVRSAHFFASPMSLDETEVCLRNWLVGGLGCEVPIFDDDPRAGWDFVAELLLTLEQPSGNARFYSVSGIFETVADQRTLFAVSAERITMVNVFGTD